MVILFIILDEYDSLKGKTFLDNKEGKPTKIETKNGTAYYLESGETMLLIWEGDGKIFMLQAELSLDELVKIKENIVLK